MPKHQHTTTSHHIVDTHTHCQISSARSLQAAVAMYGVANGANLDKDSSQIVVCPEREAAVCSCVSISLVNAFVVIATSGETARQSRHSVQ